MGRHIIQKWYEFTIAYREDDRYGWDCRLVIENDDRYGWDCRLVIENDDRLMVQKTIEYWEHDRYDRNKDWWWKMIIERIENIECRLMIENVDRWDWKYKLAS